MEEYMHNRLSGAIFVCLLGLFTTTSKANLIDNGGGLIYDEDMDITWLANANRGGLKDWDDALAWAASLDIGGTTGWRLPTADTCTGPACDAEFNHLFYNELGGSMGTPITGDNSPFLDIQGVYWTNEERDEDSAWLFYFGNAGLAGRRGWAFNYGLVSTWAVHDGNISTPIPPAMLLFGTGLLGLVFMARKKSI
jgi:hypothetical protein